MSSRSPLQFCISVPIGAYHPFLPACLESLAQQEGPVAVALLDASGDDRVRALADRYDHILAYRRHGPDKGQSDAIAEGWRHTQGDILGWLNADDILFPGAIKKARAALAADQSLDAVYGHSTILDEHARTVGYHWAVEKPGQRILEAGIISQPSCFFKRSAYDAIGGLDLDLHYTMDWDLWIRLYESGARFGFIDEVLSLVLWGDETKTSSFNAQRRAELKQLISAHAPPEKAKKIFRSFAIHNFLDRTPSEQLKKFITRKLVRGRAQIFGMGGDGQLFDGARLFLTHYEPEAKSGLEINLENPDRVSAIKSAAGDPLPVTRSDGTLTLELETPVHSGEPLEIFFTLKEPGAYFHHAAWC